MGRKRRDGGEARGKREVRRERTEKDKREFRTRLNKTRRNITTIPSTAFG